MGGARQWQCWKDEEVWVGRADGEGMAVGLDLSSISAFFLTLAEPQSL